MSLRGLRDTDVEGPRPHARGTVEGFMAWVSTGATVPSNLVEALEAAGDLFASAPQVQADLFTTEDDDAIYAVAEYHQIQYWMELANIDAGEADLSQDILCPLGATMIEGVKEPGFAEIAPRAQRHLRRNGRWFPNPNRVSYVRAYGRFPQYPPYWGW